VDLFGIPADKGTGVSARALDAANPDIMNFLFAKNRHLGKYKGNSLSHYVAVGVDKLDQNKVTPLLRLH
jgi:hypothetical protein